MDQVGYSLVRPGVYIYLPNLQDLSIKYLLNCLNNRPPGPGFQAGVPTHDVPLCSFSSSLGDMVPMVPILVMFIGEYIYNFFFYLLNMFNYLPV
jgi:hypothetical protein